MPTGIVAPVNENPITVSPLAESINPLASAEPPEAPVIFKPEISNWKPAMGTSFVRRISI